MKNVHDPSYKALLQEIVESLPIRVFWKDRASRYLGANSLFARDAGWSRAQQLIGKTDFDMGWRDQAEAYRADDQAVMESGEPKLNFQEQQTTPDGRMIWLRTSKVPLHDAEQNVIGILGMYEDITQAKQAELNQKHLTRALKLLSKCNNALIRAEDEQGLLSTICRLAVETGGYRMAWVGFAQHDASRSVRPMAQSGYEDGYLDGMAVSWADTPLGQGPTGTAIRTGHTTVNQNVLTNPKMLPWRELAVLRGYQSSIALPLIVNSRVLGALTIYAAEASAFNAGEVELLEELANDLAYGIQTLRTRIQHQAAEKKLEFLAHYDPLTGLPNRRLLQDRFNQAAAVAKREHSTVAVLFLDLDNFKQVNDSLGHGCGDRLLVQVAQRLQGCIRASDTISRQGGDEFVILLHDVPEVAIVEEITQGIVDAFAESFSVDSYTINTSFSIGISLFPEDDSDLNTLLKHADTALYHAKEAGRNTYRFFSGQMNRDALEHMQLQGQLREALKSRQLELHYQPQVDAVSGQIIGAEALLRWQHPQWGLLGPGRFIGLAERSGLIIPIGEWVLNEACRQAEEWRQMNLPSPIAVAVNLSALQFKRGNLVETVSRALAQSGLPAGLLELELTESFLLHDLDGVRETLRRLKEIGVKISIDDFGTGYSSLSYLKRLAVNKLKIDQSFIRDMEGDSEDVAIVKAIIQLGHTLGLTVIAEGVETGPQLALLRSYGCDEIQGFLFSRPLPSQEFANTLRQRLASGKAEPSAAT